MYDWVLPDLLIPIHGEYRHLNEHVKFSKKCGIKNQLLVENGDLVKLSKDSTRQIVTRVHCGRNVLKGNKIIPIDHKFLKDLDFISANGEVFVNLIMSVQDRLLTDPIIYSKSILLEESNKNELSKILTDSVVKLSENSIDDEVLRNEIKIQIRGYLKNKIGLKPLTCVEIVRI